MESRPSEISSLTPEQEKRAERLLGEARKILAANPLEGFHACAESCAHVPFCHPRPRQHDFMAAQDRIVAAFAGNRFGKTAANVVWAIVQHTPDEFLPDHLTGFKRAKSDVVAGRYLCPSQTAIETIVLPEFKRWMPKHLLQKGGWAGGYSKRHNIIYFADGGRIELYTYEQDASVMVGASLDYVVYDEPPPEGHYRENLVRTTDRAGCHRIGLTPVNMQGGGIGWIKREIFDRARPDHPDHNPDIHVVRGTMHDNPLLSPSEIAFTLAQYPEDERQAREHGDFIHFGGMIYPGGFERVKRDPPKPEEIRRMDVIVGIDPGLKNAAFIWVAFDNENRAVVFDELLLKECTPKDYKAGLDFVNSKWGVRDPRYIIDPSARNRPTSGVGQSVEALLQAQGIYPSYGQNDVQAGVQQVRVRLAESALHVSNVCHGLIGEADEYRMEDRPDGEFKVVKENDHRLDALRYVVMERLWWSPPEEPEKRTARYSDPTFEPPYDPYVGVTPEYGPMGPFT